MNAFKGLRACFSALLLGSVTTAYAGTVYPLVLDFNDLDDVDFVADFYGGGTNDSGITGPDFGITMSSYVVLNPDGDGHAYTEPAFTGTPMIQFETPFRDGFAFDVRNEVSTSQPLHVRAWDIGGFLVVNEDMSLASGGGWMEVSFAFAGAVAVDRVSISSGLDYRLAFDNMTFGSTTVVPLPAGAWLFLSALAALGITQRRDN